MKKLNYIGNSKFGLQSWGWPAFKDINIDHTLDYLCTHLPLKNWILTGGFAVDIICGKQVRPRTDIDLCVSFNDLQQSFEDLRTKDSEYAFEIQLARFPRPIRLDLVEFPTSITTERLRGRHFKFVSKRYLSGEAQRLEDVVDVFASVDSVDLTKGVNFVSVKNDIFSYTTSGAKQIPVYGQTYQAYLKNIWKRKKDYLDLSALDRVSSRTQ